MDWLQFSIVLISIAEYQADAHPRNMIVLDQRYSGDLEYYTPIERSNLTTVE